MDKLEGLFKEEAQSKYLVIRERQDQQQSLIKEREYQTAEFLHFDPALVGRRNRFFEKLKRKQKEIKAGHTKAQSSYKSIVHEPTVADQENFLTYLVNRLFTTGRKLKPIVH